MLEKFRNAVSCYDREMPILLCTCLRGYVHYKKEAYAMLCGYIIKYITTNVHKICIKINLVMLFRTYLPN